MNLVGTSFDVHLGPKHQLILTQYPSHTWAGNQPFIVQPKIAIVDAGGNVIINDSTTEVVAFITPSLAYNSEIIIDTKDDALPCIVSVTYSREILEENKTMYSAGDIIPIEVIFDQEVLVSLQVGREKHNASYPSLLLNVTQDSNNSLSVATLRNIDIDVRTRSLGFDYIVAAGHNQYPLNYLNNASLSQNDYIVLDGWGRDVPLHLPHLLHGNHLASTKKISVNSQRAKVLNITLISELKTFGAGDEVLLQATFSREVSPYFSE